MADSEDNPLICHCMVVDRDTICKAIAAGATSIEAVQDATYASMGCGTCRFEVQQLLLEAGHGESDQAGPQRP